MKYRISKIAPDSRVSTCGVVLPDGCYRILDMTRWNGRNLEVLAKVGYIVEELAEADRTPSGLYSEETGLRITDDSGMAKADMKGEHAEAPADYKDKATYLGMPADVKAKRLGKVAPRRDPASVTRAQRITQGALAEIASEQRVAAKLGLGRGNR